MSEKTISSLTHKSYIVNGLDSGPPELNEVARSEPAAIPIIQFGESCRCPYHADKGPAGCICIAKAPVLEVDNLNIGLAAVPALKHKKYFLRYCRRVFVCTNPDPSILRSNQNVTRTKAGYPLFIVESGIYDFNDKSISEVYRKCLVCCNNTSVNSPQDQLVLAPRNSSRKSAALCLRCNSIMLFADKFRSSRYLTELENARKIYKNK